MKSISAIRGEADYRSALIIIDQLIDSPDGSSDANRLEIISLLVADYVDKHKIIPTPDPIIFIEFIMESRGLTRKDLEPYIGSRARVAEILNRRRGLSLDMIRNLCSGLDLPPKVLIKPYATVKVKARPTVKIANIASAT